MNRNRGKLMGQPITQQHPSPAGAVRLETFIPWTLVKRGARKQVITPLDAPQAFRGQGVQGPVARAADPDSALLKALGLAHYWQRSLDEGKVTSVEALARAEKIGVTQVRRLLWLSLLAPDVIDALARTTDVRLDGVIRARWPTSWSRQAEVISGLCAAED